MGDPRRFRNKSERPKKLWDTDRITHDKALRLQYGLRNMRELWMATAELKKYRREARLLNSLPAEEKAANSGQILTKLARMGILKEGSGIDDVLSLEVRHVLERRLQTLVLRKGLAKTAVQSRQLITHGFISVNGRRVTRPSYLVDLNEEATMGYARPIDLSVKTPEEKPEEAKPEAKAEAAPAEPQPAKEAA